MNLNNLADLGTPEPVLIFAGTEGQLTQYDCLCISWHVWQKW